MPDYRTEFPDFALPNDVAIPAGFVDASWHNDACPSWVHAGLGLRLWISEANPAERDGGAGVSRFYLCRDTEGEDVADLVASDDWSDIEAALAEVAS